MPTQKDYLALANRIAKEKFGDTALADVFLRMMAQESGNFDPDVVEGRRKSSAGATGIAQLMPVHFSQVNPLDPEAALRYGADYLSTNIKTFNGDIAKGVAAYNGGPGTVNNAVARGGGNWRGSLPGETQEYLRITLPSGTGGGAPMPVANAPAAASAPPMPAAARAPVFAADMPKGEGGWMLPAAGSITSRFGSPFGMDSAGTYQGRTYAHFNKGVDIGGANIGGAPVRAMVAGTVKLAADDKSGWGPRVVVTDAEGFDHSYGHLANLAVTQGQKVTAGQQLAIVAPTAVGTSSGPHLSYDVTKNGELVDPTPWLTGGRAGSTAVDPAITHDPAKALRPTYLSDATGVAPASTPTTPAGAAAPRGGAAVTTQSPQTDAIATYNQRAQRAEKDYNDAYARIQALSTKPNLTLEEKNELSTLIEILSTLRKAADDATDAATTLTLRTPTGVSPDKAAETEVSWAVLRENQRKNDIDIVSTLLANDREAQKLALAIIQHNDLNAEREVASGIEKGKLTSADAQAILTARHNQQVEQLVWAGQGFERAKWIDEVNFRNAERILPPGTRYQRGFEPPSTLNKALELWGLPPIVVETTQVPRESLDPMANLARGRASLEQAGVSRPNYESDIQRQVGLFNEHQALPTFTAPKGGAQPPAGTSAGDWQSQLSALLSGNQPPPDIAAADAQANAEPQPLPTPSGESPGVAFDAGAGTGNPPGGTPPLANVPGVGLEAGAGTGNAVTLPPNRVGGQEAPRQNPEVGRGGPAPGPLPRPVQRQPAATPAPVIGPQRGPQPGPAPAPAGSAARAGYYDPNTGEYVFANGMRMRVA